MWGLPPINQNRLGGPVCVMPGSVNISVELVPPETSQVLSWPSANIPRLVLPLSVVAPASHTAKVVLTTGTIP